jgi:hypothetical protein
MEETPKIEDDLGEGGKLKYWLQDNIRIILSVLIVIAIASGIYSYSKRGVQPEEGLVAIDEIGIEEVGEAVTILGEEEDNGEAEEESKEADSVVRLEEAVDTNEVEPVEEQEDKTKITAIAESQDDNQEEVSQETGEAFVETAVSGDSLTTLARKATRHYLEKNNDSELTVEHKIYIEDYLRRQVDQKAVNSGTQVSFSKTMIKDAIEKSKTLNENQLENLKKYSARTSGI